MEKPSVLYHGSSNKEITRFEPSSKKVRDPAEGPRIFATPDKRMASVFIVGVDDSWGNSGQHNGTPYMVISDRERFETLDKGGAIYHLPNETFTTDPNKGLGDLEWASSEPVEPTGKEDHESALEAMLNHGVQVYFVDRATYQAFETAPDHGLSILQTTESENQRRNINPIQL
jgi:hypothetical protein